jgi:hypothetical protein
MAKKKKQLHLGKRLKRWENIDVAYIFNLVFKYRFGWRYNKPAKKGSKNYYPLKGIKKAVSEKQKVQHDFTQPITVKDELMRSLNEIRIQRPNIDKEVPEWGFGGTFNRVTKKLEVKMHEGDSGSVNSTKGNFDFVGHTHPDYNTDKKENNIYSWTKNFIIPDLKYKRESNIKQKNDLDARFFNTILDVPSFDDAYNIRSRTSDNPAPGIVIAPNHNIVMYPDTTKHFIPDDAELKFDELSNRKVKETAFADAVLKSEINWSKSLPEYKQRLGEFEKIYHKNIQNIFSNVDVKIEYVDKEKDLKLKILSNTI